MDGALSIWRLAAALLDEHLAHSPIQAIRSVSAQSILAF